VGGLPERLALQRAAHTSLTVFDLSIKVQPMTCSVLSRAPLIEQAEMKWILG
jgi:hypothetical protein